MKNTVVVLAGPTAAGKTALAIRIAQQLGTEIISADSRQCYRELSIGTAKPTAAELSAVPHYFIDSHSIREEVNAAMYEQLALQYTAEIFSKHPVAIVAGGTGLYIRAFLEGMDQIPPVPDAIRASVRENYAANGLAWLQETLQQRDPSFYATAETQNPQRLMRALEVLEATGQSISTFRTATPRNRDFRVIKIGVQLPKELLHENIVKRVDAMMAAGLVDEAASVKEYRHHNALQTVGYTEIFDYFDGKLRIAEAAEAIKIHTRQYAKRQLTWFRRDREMQWFDAREGDEVMKWLEQQL
ncbi:tRNA (adenosine(37)-N6)-dimethylallyltransferase MiaA [Chitinophaga sp. SYP-B3965]|uniref:tRNA (adenosine(37)-N6)-dimethylallyltransferase MiaA n=1 Tax=Chitinophaga sp. SYP-B3965 TaxID=2663120 RepID=UPI001299940E|nr:tRNA (adenosine(37)-N6)-dimethylallyltransferase MiaA [Chitinophaga sp. SYP-B3965]MRG43610.1 tRNA (adenosine(37)-N6)-dimethylallyltransferase MiaA [Chitinophaga sp. SYP-B3965]